MSNQDGQTAIGPGNGDGVWRVEPGQVQTTQQASPVVQLGTPPRSVCGEQGPQGGQGHHASVQARQPKVQFGGNATLSREALEEAVLARAKEAAAQAGKDLGSHLHLRSEFFFYDAAGREVAVDHVVVVVRE